ncbi:protein of unknown function DUF324 [Parafrankia sp. EAN1pec]|uniref:RAMP superfamily CRISPR-associated protein n=1 Tax=Parafrankia sp. (strain EAN1pec) TaxID=298653 RepID=UPI0000543577|nr:protein of unknown function DUF324 [Frankia sp. EAN1pec]
MSVDDDTRLVGSPSPPDGPPAALTAESELQIRTLSDWHVGSGARIPGRVNAAVRRDDDGLPYLPGTTLTGVLRDACLTVARGLDDGARDGTWEAWHQVLFGELATEGRGRAGRWLRPAALGVGAGRLSAGLRARLIDDPALRRETTFVKPGVRIDPETGRATDDMLRFVEMARVGLPLTAAVHIDLPEARSMVDDRSPVDEMWRAVTALLVLGAAWCERVGGDRRRGAGWVVLRWAGQDPAVWAEWLSRSGWTPEEPPATEPAAASVMSPPVPPDPPDPSPEARVASGSDSAAAEPVRLELRLTCVAPVRVPRQVIGNITLGHDHIPGAALLSWLSARWGDRVVRAAVASDDLLVRHAYPEIAGRRGLPAPLCLFRVRRTGELVNAARVQLPGEPARQVRDRWTVPDPVGDGVVLVETPLGAATHNAVSRSTQRPDSPAGLYAVEVLPAGTRLRTELVVSGRVVDQLAATFGARWWEPLLGQTRMGARRKGEYGLVQVDTVSPEGPTVCAPVTGRVCAGPPSLGGEFQVWAAADLVVSSRSLRQTGDPEDVRAALTTRLDGGGLRLGWAAQDGRLACVTRTRRRDSWQGRWQLPRESIVGLAAGSVLTLRVEDGAIDPAAWADLADRGLGERRAEGFGEVVIDAPLLDLAHLRAAEPAAAADDRTGEDRSGEQLSEAEQAALHHLRGSAVVSACRARLIELREQPDPPAGYAALRRGLRAMSPSQRSTWLTLANDAVLRAADTRLRAECARWTAREDRDRDTQRRLAECTLGLLDGGIEEVAGSGPLDAQLRREVFALLVGDLMDAARRPAAADTSDRP